MFNNTVSKVCLMLCALFILLSVNFNCGDKVVKEKADINYVVRERY